MLFFVNLKYYFSFFQGKKYPTFTYEKKELLSGKTKDVTLVLIRYTVVFVQNPEEVPGKWLSFMVFSFFPILDFMDYVGGTEGGGDSFYNESKLNMQIPVVYFAKI